MSDIKEKGKIYKAIVKADKRQIEMYKLTTGGFNIYLGDNMNQTTVAAGTHMEQFKEEELTFID